MKRPRGFGRVYRRPNRQDGHWYVYWYAKGDHHESVAKALGKPHDQVTERDAERLLDLRLKQKLKGEVVSVRRHRLTVAQLLDAYRAHLDVKGIKNAKDADAVVRAVKTWAGGLSVTSLTREKLTALAQDLLRREYVVKGARRPYSRGTVKVRLGTLHAAMAYGHDELGLPPPPRFPALKVDNARTGFFDLDEFRMIAGQLPDPADDLAFFGYLTGWRVSECRQLAWDRVDLPHASLRLDESKTGGRVRPIVEGALLGLLRKRWRLRAIGCPFVFHRAGRPVSDTWFGTAWRKACATAGLAGRRFHDFRRTAYNDFVSHAGVDLVTSMELTGHKSLSVARRYNVVEEKRMRRALEAVARFREAQGLSEYPDNSRADGPKAGPISQ
jgi:integrase